MPKLRETREQQADRRFRMAYAAGLERTDLTRPEVAAKLHVSSRTMSTYKAEPAKLTLDKLRALYRAGVLTEDDVTAIVCV